MRFYRIELARPDGTPIKLDSYGASASPLPLTAGASLEEGVITSLLPDGTTNPAALNVEIDIEQMPMHVGDQKSFVRIYGLALTDVFRRDLNPDSPGGKYNKIKVSVGMEKGLPLADPTQKGMVMSGVIYQAFGNWLGTDMTLDLIIGPDGVGSPDQPQNYVINWQKGQKISDAISEALKNSPLADLKQKITVSDDRVAKADSMPGYYSTAAQLAQWINDNTKGQRGTNDLGIYVYLDGQTVIVGDTSINPGGNAKEIKFRDLIGQVTWFSLIEMTCKLVMRGDLDLFGLVKFPQAVPVQTTAAALSGFTPSRDRDTPGIGAGATFQVNRIHHWGNYRQPDAMSWNTTLGLLRNQNAQQ